MARNGQVSRIRQFLTPPVFGEDEEKNRAASLANTILLALIALITLASLLVVLVLKVYAIIGVIYVSMVLPLFVALAVLRRGHVRAASLIITLTLWLVLVVAGFLIGGVVNAGYTTLTLVIIISALLLGGRAGLIVAALSVLAVGFVFISEVIGILPPPLGENDALSYLINHILNYGIASALLYLAMQALTSTLQRAQQLAAESEARREQLQLLVQQHTQDLERNTNYLRATTAVAHESAAVLGDPQQLLTRVVNVISEQFGFYHVAIYMVEADDAGGLWAEIRAASSQEGRQLLARGHRLRVGVEGMIGDVARRGVYRVAEDVSRDAAYRRAAELPDTRAELVLPLQLRGEIIGVLDVQSTKSGVFSGQDIQTLQALADQVAIAISNARLFEQVQRAAEVERRAYGALTADAWRSMLQAGQQLGFHSHLDATEPAGDLWQPEMRVALQTGNTVHNTEETGRLAVPVKVRGEVVGVIDFAKHAGGRAWTEEEIALVESLTEQLGVALDSARLYQDTQRRAAQERVVGEVTGHIRETLDMETMLRTAAEQMRQALDLEDLVVRLAKSKPR